MNTSTSTATNTNTTSTSTNIITNTNTINITINISNNSNIINTSTDSTKSPLATLPPSTLPIPMRTQKNLQKHQGDQYLDQHHLHLQVNNMTTNTTTNITIKMTFRSVKHTKFTFNILTSVIALLIDSTSPVTAPDSQAASSKVSVRSFTASRMFFAASSTTGWALAV